MFTFTYIAALFGVIALVYGIFLLYERFRDNRALYLGVMVISAGVWALANAYADVSYTESMMRFWCGIALISIVVLACALLAFTYIITHVTRGLSFRRSLFYFVPALITIPFAFSKLSVPDVFLLYTAPAQNTLGILYIPLTAFVYLSFIFSSFYLFRFTHISSRITRLQVIYITIGMLCTLLAIAVFTIILPVVFQELRFYTVSPLSVLPMVLFISYAIFKHRLIDIRLVIQKGVIYILLLSGILGIYLLLIFILSIGLHSVTHTTIIISGGLVSIIGIISSPYIISYFRRVTDRFFFKDTYNYSFALHELSETLNKSTNLSDITRRTSSELASILRAEYVSLSLAHKTIPSLESPPALIVPIRFETRTIGTIMLGPKKSGDMYSDDDRLLLRTFSHHVAAALERARLYEEVKQYTGTLEEKVDERTKEIKSLQEEQRKVMMDIAHGLQTPLTLVKSRIHMFSKKRGEDIEFSFIEKSVDEISEFIYKLLTLAKLGSKHEELEKEKVSLSNLLKDICEYVETIAEDAGIRVRCSVEKHVFVWGNRKRLEEMILNLVSNSIKYMDNKSTKEISVSLSKERRIVRLVISDTGIGIDSEDLPHIFERFYRSKYSTGEKTEGTGLGLAISKEIVQRHDGTIEAQSIKGKGTEITVCLPLYDKKSVK